MVDNAIAKVSELSMASHIDEPPTSHIGDPPSLDPMSDDDVPDLLPADFEYGAHLFYFF
jgi:hypothetical protein